MADPRAEAGTPPAAEVVMAKVAPGNERTYENLRAALDAKAAAFPGFVGVEVFSPPPGEDDWTAVLNFESQDRKSTRLNSSH